MNRARLFIRHADKGIVTDDDPIIDNQEIRILNRAKHLEEKYNRPDVILVSPYLRTRQTAILLNEGLHNPVEMLIEPLLGEYMKPHRPYYLRWDTLLYEPAMWDNKETMINRIIELLDKYKHYEGTIWFVCHGGFLTTLQEIYEDYDIRPPTLSAYVITRNETCFDAEDERI